MTVTKAALLADHLNMSPLLANNDSLQSEVRDVLLIGLVHGTVVLVDKVSVVGQNKDALVGTQTTCQTVQVHTRLQCLQTVTLNLWWHLI